MYIEDPELKYRAGFECQAQVVHQMTDDMSQPSAISQSTVGMLFDLRHAQYTCSAAVILLIYDCILTWDQEYKTIWKSKWTIGKVLFLVNRYGTFIVLVGDAKLYIDPDASVSFCKAWLLAGNVIELLVFAVIEAILVMRTFALFGKSKSVGIGLGTLAVVTILSEAVLLAIQYKPVSFAKNPFAIFGCYAETQGCTTGPCLVAGKLFWLPLVVCDASVCCLTLYRLYQHMRKPYPPALITLMLRDAIIYFVLILGINLANLIIWNTAPLTRINLLPEITKSLVSVLCSRLLLNIRDAVGPGQESYMLPVRNMKITNNGNIIRNEGTVSDFMVAAPSEYSTNTGDTVHW